MGDIADMMLEGSMCQGCGEILDGQGYPTYCPACQREQGVDKYGEKRKPPQAKAKCPICGKRVKQAGVSMHMKDVHNAHN